VQYHSFFRLNYACLQVQFFSVSFDIIYHFLLYFICVYSTLMAD